MPDYPICRTARSGHYAENLEWFETTRESALQKPCMECHAQAGECCRNDVTGEPLKRFPAHPSRIEAARAAS